MIVWKFQKKRKEVKREKAGTNNRHRGGVPLVSGRRRSLDNKPGTNWGGKRYLTILKLLGEKKVTNTNVHFYPSRKKSSSAGEDQ